MSNPNNLELNSNLPEEIYRLSSKDTKVLNEAVLVPMTFGMRIHDVNSGEPLGTFKEVDGKLTFEGDVDGAGKLFVDFICKSFNERIKNERKELEQAVLACEKVVGKERFSIADSEVAQKELQKALKLIKQ